MAVYASDELDIETGTPEENNVFLKDWLTEGRTRLEAAREAIQYLCEPVAAPRQVEQFLFYFCGDAVRAESLAETEPLRIAYYKGVATLTRAYSDLVQHLEDAGYSSREAESIRDQVAFHAEVRAAIKRFSGEELDIKPYEADMRHLLNNYVRADEAHHLGDLDEMSLIEMIIETGIHDAIAKKLNERKNLSRRAVAEGIINNVRRTIIRDQLTDPRFYEQMSKLLDDLIAMERATAEAYEEFLRKAEELVRQLGEGGARADLPSSLAGRAEAAVIYSNLPNLASTSFLLPESDEERAALALAIDQTIRESAPAGWRGDSAREGQVLNALFPLLARDRDATLALFEIVKRQSGY